METRDCLTCGATFTTYPSLNKRYCGKKCFYAARRKETITSRYRMVYKPGHPLAGGVSPYIPEHRLLLWEKIGPGTHPCYTCGTPVTWSPGSHTSKGSLVVDHVDRDGHNNDPANLEPSCHSCNSRNQKFGVRDDEPHLVSTAGHRVRGETRYCNLCGKKFVAWPSKSPNKGRYCSRFCAGTGPKIES